jgi:GNAT superfamily N-acetyltransferase
MKNADTDIVCRLPRDSDLDPTVVRRLSALVNAVYDTAESGMWKTQGLRTSPEEMAQLLRTQALILAEHRGNIVGCVAVKLMDGAVAEFGMLVADPAQRGAGIGSALIEAAEDWARARNCDTMRLELLTPRTWKHPSKEFLTAWYSRIGYRPQFTEPLEKLYPDKVAELATECDFTVWHKRL